MKIEKLTNLLETLFFSQNSIKMLRGKKNLQKATTLQKKTETDSQHTQVINMELGKAAGLVFLIEILTNYL